MEEAEVPLEHLHEPVKETRSVRAWRNHVSDRDCHRGDFSAHKETQILDCEFAFWTCRLRLSRPGGNLR